MATSLPWLRRPLDLRWWYAAVLVAISLPYLPVLRAGFVWDDTIFLHDLPVYRQAGSWLVALRQPFVLSPNYFRPLSVFTFLADLRLWGLNPFPFHLTNLLLHLLNTALVMLLTHELVTGESASDRSARYLPLLGGLLYGLHPVLVESVAFISGRFDLLVTTFLLLALLADLRWRARPLRRATGVALAFLAAALCKEMAVAFGLALPAWHLATTDSQRETIRPSTKAQKHKSQPKKASSRPSGDAFAGRLKLWRAHRAVYAGLLAGGVIYLALRAASLGMLYWPGTGNPLPVGTPWPHLLLVGQSLLAYLLLLLWPFTTLMPIHFTSLPVPPGGPAVLRLALAGISLGAVACVTRRHPRSGWLLVAGLLALLPVINLLPLELGGGAFIAERFLTFPLVFFALAMTVGLRTLSRQLIMTGVGLWLVGATLTVALTVPHWHSDLTLWRWGTARAPQSAVPYTNLSKALTEAGNPAAGLTAAEDALSHDPQSANAWNHKGLALFHLGRYAEAEQSFAEATRVEPDSLLYWNNLAGALREQGRLQEAAAVLIEEVLARSDLPVAHLNLGIVYLRADRPDLAAEHLQIAAQRLAPDQAAEAQRLLEQTANPALWLRLGDLLLNNGEAQAALRAFEQAERLGAPVADARLGGSAALIQLDKLGAAEALLQSVLALAPEDAQVSARVHNNLGVVARERGDLATAREHFRRAVELAPDWAIPGENLADAQ